MEELKDTVKEHENYIAELRHTVYGNKDLNVKGMNEKVDEIHTILVQAKGIKGFFGMIIMFGVLILTLKGWFIGGK